MKKIALILVFLLIFSGCRNVGKTEIPIENYPVVIGGMKFLDAPEKIVVLSEGLLNIITEAGFENFVSEEKEIGDEYYPDAEKIIESKAELVLSFMEIEASVVKTLSEENIRILVLKRPQTMAELKDVISSVSRLFLGELNGEKEAEKTYKKYENEITPIKTTFEENTFVYIKNRELEPIKNSLLNDVLGETFKNKNPEALTEETLKELNPDYIFLGSGIDEAYLNSLPVAENLSAIENEKIISLPENLLDSFKSEDFKNLRKPLGIE